MLIKNDESCNSEKTILRYQENGIADLLASDWYGIMLLSPGVSYRITCNNGNQRTLINP